MKYTNLQDFLVDYILPNLRRYNYNHKQGMSFLSSTHSNSLTELEKYYRVVAEYYTTTDNIGPNLKAAYYSIVITNLINQQLTIKQIYNLACDLNEIECEHLNLQNYYNILLQKAESLLTEILKLTVFEEYVSYIYLIGIKLEYDMTKILQRATARLCYILFERFNKKLTIEKLFDSLDKYIRLRESKLYSQETDNLLANRIILWVSDYLHTSQGLERNDISKIRDIVLIISNLKIQFNSRETYKQFSLIKKELTEPPHMQKYYIPSSFAADFLKENPQDLQQSYANSHYTLKTYKATYQLTEDFSDIILVKSYKFFPSERILSRINFEVNTLLKLSGLSYFPIIYATSKDVSQEVHTYTIITSFGIPLRTYLQEDNQLTRQMMQEIISAYAHLSNNRISARNISPDVIFVVDNNHIVVYDFSLMVSAQRDLERDTDSLYDAFGDLASLLPVNQQFLYRIHEFMLKHYKIISQNTKEYLEKSLKKQKCQGNNPKKTSKLFKKLESLI